MKTLRNKKSKKSRRGGANECERLPFSRLSYDELHSNYQKYCMNTWKGLLIKIKITN